MRKYIIEDTRLISPFNESARELRILNKPLWLAQRDALAPYTRMERVVSSLENVPEDRFETIVYRDNLFFDQEFIDEFISRARSLKKACRVAFAVGNKAIEKHALMLQSGIRREGDVYVADMWYFPHGRESNIRPLVIDMRAKEKGYYEIPQYMAPHQGDLVYYVPQRAFLSIEHWVHIFIANITFGVFAEGARVEEERVSSIYKLRLLWQSLIERRPVLSSTKLIKKGSNVSIHPSAVILGPTVIGDNVTIDAGAVIDVCHIGSNVTIGEGCHLQLSVVSDRCFLPFRASLFMTALMENSMVAQNTCLQMCVIGRDTFIGAGNTFTDFNILPTKPKPIRVFNRGQLEEVGMPVLGGCVGHNCRIGSGLVIFPARSIESDVVLLGSREEKVLTHNVSFEESDHHSMPNVSVGFEPQYRPKEPQSIGQP